MIFVAAVLLNLIGSIGFFFLAETSVTVRSVMLGVSVVATLGFFLVGASALKAVIGVVCAVMAIVYVFYFKHIYM